MAKSYFDRNPIRNLSISPDVHNIFLNTPERRACWYKIKAQEEAKVRPAVIVMPKSIKPFVQFNN